MYGCTSVCETADVLDFGPETAWAWSHASSTTVTEQPSSSSPEYHQNFFGRINFRQGFYSQYLNSKSRPIRSITKLNCRLNSPPHRPLSPESPPPTTLHLTLALTLHLHQNALLPQTRLPALPLRPLLPLPLHPQQPHHRQPPPPRPLPPSSTPPANPPLPAPLPPPPVPAPALLARGPVVPVPAPGIVLVARRAKCA